MSQASELIDGAFEVLGKRPGFSNRADQRQLARLIGDLIEEEASGAFEAPTGLGKSLAALIPAIAHALNSNRRTVIATYTNVLAEQYWRKDLPLARELFAGGERVRAQLLMGRSRYTCLAALEEHARESVAGFRAAATIGHESDFRKHVGRSGRELNVLWSKVATPAGVSGAALPPLRQLLLLFRPQARREGGDHHHQSQRGHHRRGHEAGHLRFGGVCSAPSIF